MKNILRIIKLSRPLWGLAGLMSSLIILTSVLELVNPIVSKLIVDQVVERVDTGGGDLNRLYLFIGLWFAVSIFGILIRAIGERLGDHFAGRLRQFLTEKFYDKTLRLSQSYFDTELSGKIVNQLNRGIGSIQEFMNTSTNFIIPALLQSAFTIAILSYYNIWIGLFVFLLFPVYISISYYSAKKWGELEGKKNSIEDINRGRIQEVITNIRLVKGYTNELKEYNNVSDNLTEINKIYAKQSRDFHLFDFFRNFSLTVILLGVNIILFYNAFQENITIGELVLILQLVAQARWPLYGMSFILEAVQRAESGSKEYFEVLNLESAEDYTIDEDVEKVKDPKLKFEDIKFEYDTSGTVLDGINFEATENEVVALVGPSGAGKSTVINLILKLYKPTAGKIMLNNQDFTTLSTNFIRKNVALVFQENELFSSTIKENVAYGIEASDDQVIDALKKANAWDFVQKLPDGINSNIGERGVKLSGGQKQRVQIARAILKDAPILILDEATSNLDAKSEAEVQEALENLMEGRLTIIIAHRFSTIQNATKVIVLNNKRIEAIGSPQDLAKKDGIYKELLEYQIEGNKKLLKKFEIY